MKKISLILSVVAFIAFSAFVSVEGKYITKAAHINFFSHTSVEDISADNFKVISTIDSETGVVVFSVPMQSFEFEKALMQKHYNSTKFLDTKTYPKAKYKGKIVNLSEINFSKEGVYEAKIEGEMTIKGITKPSNQNGQIHIKGGQIHIKAKTKIILADYGIGFEKGKPASNISKEIEVTVKAKYQK